MSRRATLVAFLAAVVLGMALFVLSARNDFCVPWQERVGYGDGPLGPAGDFTACR